MIVILQKDLKGTGKAGDVVKVSDGYARNMLIPKGIAKEATEGNIRNLEKQKEIAAEKKAEQKAAAEENAKKISGLSVTIKTKGGEGGRLFGSITSKDIAQALADQHKIKVDKKKIDLDSPIKQTGDFTIPIKLYPEVTAQLKVTVTV
ncbi:50S ribosomal protein L9 [Anaerovorax odorimutans]|uniref:Large ribosomal subunit protein bL9 n=1 Tax=Anaerovorax odorimutans TaxID=109327 RepID=A0ABT1RQL8_9FIRM|nr:50S ribosomal protein L9 [Anaerovorax odorimutans]MCQ4637492.1 50S ribosomal protein L9 [Anaerovorax odorimutans]